MGTREYSKAKDEEEKQEERERNIEEKKRMLRKKAGKASQRRQGKESSAPKRRKIGEGNEFEESRRVEFVKIITSVGEKRKPNGENEEPSNEITPPEPKRQKKQQKDIRLFFNNKGWQS